MKNKRARKVFIIVPILLIASISVGFSSWFIIVSNSEATPETNSYTVNFYVNNNLSNVKTGLDGNSSFDFPYPSVEGYNIDYWALYNSIDSSVHYSIKASLSDVLTNFNGIGEAIRFDASLSIKTYTVIFNSNGGTSIENQTVNYNCTVTRPSDPTKANYSFGGWYKDFALATSYDFSTAVKDDLTLYARWIYNS